MSVKNIRPCATSSVVDCFHNGILVRYKKTILIVVPPLRQTWISIPLPPKTHFMTEFLSLSVTFSKIHERNHTVCTILQRPSAQNQFWLENNYNIALICIMTFLITLYGSTCCLPAFSVSSITYLYKSHKLS